MNYLKLTNDKLDIGAISDLVADESCGAISIFAGTTRDNFEDKKVICLEYEAYEPMAKKIMTNICDDIRSKWPDIKNIAIYHRLNIVPVKEASVVIAISSPHRQSSLQSVQFAIDELKRTVPIWKKEKYENTSAAWKANKESGPLRKRKKFNFDECKIEFETIPENLIQINANDSEIKRRINYFIEKKREEIDVNNILDYTANSNNVSNCDDQETVSCARLDSVLVKRNDSKGHLKVRRVENETGPNDHATYTRALDKLMENLSNKISENSNKTDEKNLFNIDSNSLPIGIAERIENIEKYLNMNVPAPKSIYERLKKMEDKIIYLETISPEYRHFTSPLDIQNCETKTNFNAVNNNYTKKKIFTVNELNGYIEHVKNQISKGIKTENEEK